MQIQPVLGASPGVRNAAPPSTMPFQDSLIGASDLGDETRPVMMPLRDPLPATIGLRDATRPVMMPLRDSRLSQLRAPAAGAAPPTREAAEDAARQLEQVFVKYMVEGMRKSSPGGDEGGLFGSGPGTGTYEDWFDSHLSRHLTDGDGIGIARVVLRDWERNALIPAAETKGGVNVTA